MISNKIFNISLILVGLSVTAISLAADLIGLGDPRYGIGLSQIAGALTGLTVAGAGFMPAAVFRTRIPLVFAGLILLMITPFPYEIEPSIQNAMHIPIFALFSIITFSIFRKVSLNRTLRTCISLSLLVAFSFAGEVFQALIPGRTADINDAILNMIGIFIGACIYFIYFIFRTITSKGE